MTTRDVPAALAPAIDLRPLFAPRSIAVLGASPRNTIGLTLRDNLQRMGSDTACWFVNPKYDEIHGDKAYPSLQALPERPDTVILAVNPLRATRFAQEAADAGVPSLVIPGGGVVEGGEAAATMQREVRDIAIRHGIALLGPNCMGMVDWTTNTTTYIGDVNPWLPRGHIAGLAQSGSVTDAFIHSPGTRIGYSRIVSVGAEVVLDLCDYLAYCLDDPETHAVMLFVEGFKRPERFLALADHALSIGKPILAVKVGRSSQAQEAAVAHSGSLAGEDRVTDAALDAAGVIRCDDLDELMEAAELIAGCGRLGRSVGGGRTGVVTVSTGEASLVADLAARTGLDLPPVPDDARAAILRDLPTMGYIGNPLDPWGADEARPRTARASRRSPHPARTTSSRSCTTRRSVTSRPRSRWPTTCRPRSSGRPPTARTSCRSTCRSPRATSARTSRRRSMRPAGCRCSAARSRPSGRSAASPAGSGAGWRGPPTGSRRDGPSGWRWRRAARRGAPTTRSIRWPARSAPARATPCPNARASSDSLPRASP